MAETRRKFSIADGLILIAGIAAGLGFTRFITPYITPEMLWNDFIYPREKLSLRYFLELTQELGVIVGIPFMAASTPAFLVIQLIKPRSPWRRLRRQPGFIVCLLPTLITAITILVAGTSVGLSLWEPQGSPTDEYAPAYILGGFLAGSSVLSSWVTMRLCGIYRPQPTWTDRIGRLIGLAWIAIGVCVSVDVFM